MDGGGLGVVLDRGHRLPRGRPNPRVFVYLFAPVLVGIAALAGSATFRTIVDHTPATALVGVQSFRVAGAAMLLVVHLGILPAAFGSGGYGDIATGTLAIVAAVLLGRARGAGAKAAFWAFTLAGVLDLLNVAYLMLSYYPTWHQGTPSSAPLASFALVMIPAIAAPLALLLHLFAVRAMVRGESPGTEAEASRWPRSQQRAT